MSAKNTEVNFPKVELFQNDRILILAPHPDDEVIGCGGIIQKALSMNLPVKVAFLTYGDNNQWSFLVYRKHPVLMPKAVAGMGLVRHAEAIAADSKLGLREKDLVFLGYPDFRTLEIWNRHWGDTKPAESMLTHVNAVPYGNAFRPGTPHKGEEILKDIKTVIKDFKPTKIFLSHPADHNTDHRSLYLFTRVALWDLSPEVNASLYPYLVHFVKWPQPISFNPQEKLLPPQKLWDSAAWQVYSLTQKEGVLKFEALKKHRSQYNSSARYLRLFIRTNELFGDLPVTKLREKDEARPVMFVNERLGEIDETSEQLLKEERGKMVGIQSQLIQKENDHLVLTIKLSRPVGEAFGLSIYAFGYKEDKDFALMPKIHIQLGTIGHKVFDQGNSLPSELVQIERQLKEIRIRIPLGLLENPERILMSSRTYVGRVPMDLVAWRVIEL